MQLQDAQKMNITQKYGEIVFVKYTIYLGETVAVARNFTDEFFYRSSFFVFFRCKAVKNIAGKQYKGIILDSYFLVS